MLRIPKKLIDFYRRRTEGKRAWIRFFAIMLAMGSIVAFFLYHTLTVRDTREAQTTVEESFAFVKAQLVKYDNYASSDKAKSLVRLMDKADEAAVCCATSRVSAWTGWKITPASSGWTAFWCWTVS